MCLKIEKFIQNVGISSQWETQIEDKHANFADSILIVAGVEKSIMWSEGAPIVQQRPFKDFTRYKHPDHAKSQVVVASDCLYPVTGRNM